MNSLKVKICGITRSEDAQLAARLGATAIGLIFAPSARQVTLTQAQLILADLPESVLTIGVFVDADIEAVIETSDRLHLNGVQLHGSESPEFILNLKRQRPQLTIIKAFEIDEAESFNDYACDYLLIDTPRSLSQRTELNLEKLAAIRPNRPFFIAGGLNDENIIDYVDRLNPSGVDICSGVELQPGIKDEQALTLFFETLRRVSA